jgi:hypothetical protein
MDANQLTAALKVISDRSWTSTNQPVLLSALPRLLRDELDEEYKDMLAGESLKAFIKRTGPQFGYRLVEHPTQQAKIGLLPLTAHFEFEAEPTLFRSTSVSITDAHAFARVLLALTEDERKAILLPASVVVKLLTAK